MTYSAAAAAVCVLWHFISVMPLHFTFTFKNGCGRFWAKLELISDCKRTLTGTVNGSFVENVDNTVFTVLRFQYCRFDGYIGFGLHLFTALLCFGD